jgi:hypothetical protein
MTIAGFTADASLTKTEDVYREDGEHDSGADAVQPAQFFTGPVVTENSLALCSVYRCRWIDISPGTPYPPQLVRICRHEWIC